MKRYVEYKKKFYTLTIDIDGVLDTVEYQGKLLTSTNKACQFFINHQEDLDMKRPIKGVTYYTLVK